MGESFGYREVRFRVGINLARDLCIDVCQELYATKSNLLLWGGAPLTHHWLLIFILRSFINSTPDFSYILKYRLRSYYFLGGVLHKPTVQSAFPSPVNILQSSPETGSQAAAINILHSQCLG